MKKYIPAGLALAAVLSLASCSDDHSDLFDSPLEDGGKGTLTLTDARAFSLAFEWQAVEGVYQYGYFLKSEDGMSTREGVTTSTSVAFDNLEPSTLYTFAIEAYGANGQPTYRYETEAATADIVPLPAVDANAITAAVEGGATVVRWPAVENADSYSYVLKTSYGAQVGAGEVSENAVSFTKLSKGRYVIEITALTADPAFTDSEPSKASFEVTASLVGTYQGTYTSYAGGSWDATVYVYDNGLHVIEAFCNVEGYDLEFGVADDNSVNILSGKAVGEFRVVDTGLEDSPTISIYTGSESCLLTDNGDNSFTLSFTCYLGDDTVGGTDSFTWAQ